MSAVPTLIRRLATDDSGQDLVEYALLAALIGIVGILTWRAIGSGIGSDYIGWDTNIQNIAAPPDPGSGS